MEKVAAPVDAGRAQLKRVALPTEHGGWGLVSEPALLGLLLAPSLAALGLAVAGFGVFLARHPLKLALKDALRGKRYPRTVLAWKVTAGYGLLALVGLALALATARAAFWLPVLLAAPLALIQLVYDARSESRALLPELAGAVAVAGLTPTIVMAGGWALAPALALWTLLAARAVGSVVYVRARLRLERGVPVDPRPVLGLHVGALAVVAALVLAGALPALSLLAVGLLLARAALGLSPRRRPVKAKIIGIREMVYGFVVVGLTAIGVYTGL